MREIFFTEKIIIIKKIGCVRVFDAAVLMILILLFYASVTDIIQKMLVSAASTF